VQSFLKVPTLHALAPTQSEGPFVATQAATLLLFVVLGVLSALLFRGSDVESLTGTPTTTVRS
jgi:hypothetical protein